MTTFVTLGPLTVQSGSIEGGKFAITVTQEWYASWFRDFCYRGA